jgi:hypothetical protein
MSVGGSNNDSDSKSTGLVELGMLTSACLSTSFSQFGQTTFTFMTPFQSIVAPLQLFIHCQNDEI